MIDYIEKRPDGTCRIMKDDGEDSATGSPKAVCDRIAARRLATTAAAIHCAAKLLGVRRLVPLYLEKDVLLLPLSGFRAETGVYVNRCAIARIGRLAGGRVLNVFHDGRRIETAS
ncbi:MAG: hypothetical protein Q8N15_03150, partial [Bacillota bacterium]|nr:hypothetical protein [Bacillota bacterium]